MPTYEFHCDVCGKITEDIFSISSRPNHIPCKSCRTKGLVTLAKFIISTPNTHVKKYITPENYAQYMATGKVPDDAPVDDGDFFEGVDGYDGCDSTNPLNYKSTKAQIDLSKS